MDEHATAIAFWKNWWTKEGEGCQPTLYEVLEVARELPVEGVNVSPTCHVLKSDDGFMPLGTILYREEYREAEVIMSEYHRKMHGHGVVILRGQPGTGKTLFLYVLLASRLLQRLPTFFERSDGLYFFHSDGVQKLPKSGMCAKEITNLRPKMKGAWALIDGHPTFTHPAATLMREDLRLCFVMAFPRYRGWHIKPPMRFYYMRPWTWEEIVHARSFQHGPVVSETEMYRCFVDFGPFPCAVYGVNYENYQAELQKLVLEMDFEKFWMVVDSALVGRWGNSQKVLLLEPIPGDCTRMERAVTIVTAHIARLLLRASLLQGRVPFASLYFHLTRTATAPAGRMLREEMDPEALEILHMFSEVL